MSITRYCFALDLKDDPGLIAQYKHYHAAGQAWPEITKSIYDAGIVDMEIYLIGNRLFMVMDTNEHFDFEHKARMDTGNPKVLEWETLMSDFQTPLPWARGGEKWVLMERIFKLGS